MGLQKRERGRREPGVKVDQQPLVHVDVEAVKLAQPARARTLAHLLAHERRARIRCVHVHPQPVRALLPPDPHNPFKVVDRARRRRAQRRRHVEWHEPARAAALYFPPQRLPRHRVPGARARSNAAVPQPQHVGGLVRAAVRLLGAEGNEPPAHARRAVLARLDALGRVVCAGGGEAIALERGAHGALARGHHGDDDGFAGAALDDAAAAGGRVAVEDGGQVEHAGDPVEDDGLELGARGTAQPVEGGGREGGAVELAEDGGERDGRGEEGHEARRLPVRQARHDLAFNVRLNVLAPALGRFRRAARELRREVAGRDGGDHAARGEGGEVADYCAGISQRS